MLPRLRIPRWTWTLRRASESPPSHAQVNGLELQVDTNALENEFLLKKMASSETEALSRCPRPDTYNLDTGP